MVFYSLCKTNNNNTKIDEWMKYVKRNCIIKDNYCITLPVFKNLKWSNYLATHAFFSPKKSSSVLKKTFYGTVQFLIVSEGISSIRPRSLLKPPPIVHHQEDTHWSLPLPHHLHTPRLRWFGPKKHLQTTNIAVRLNKFQPIWLSPHWFLCNTHINYWPLCRSLPYWPPPLSIADGFR